MIKSFELEKKVLSGILQHQDLWPQIALLIKEGDFFSYETLVHLSLFRLMRNALNNKEIIDDTILVERVKGLGVSFPDDINLPEYIYSLNRYKISPEVFLTAVKDLKKVTLRRVAYESGHRIQNFVKGADPSLTYSELVNEIDAIHNKTISDFESVDSRSVNLCSMAEPLIEELGNNPPDEVGLMSPYRTINRIYGSIFRGGNITCIAARAKCGKMLKLDEKILTVSGWKDHSSIKVGDVIITPNGKTANVTGYFPHSNQEIYRITFSDGRTIDGGLDHLWNVWGRHDGDNWKYKVVDTSKLIEYLNSPSKRTRTYIDLIGSIDGPSVDLPINPYLLGCLIGDEGLTSSMRFSNSDAELIQEIKNILGDEYIVRHISGYDYQIVDCKNSETNRLKDSLQLLNLFGKRTYEKFIPDVYKKGSFEQRGDLLRGLLDTDGFVSKGGNVEYYTTSESLSKDVQQLVWSLGGICKVEIKKTFIKETQYRDCFRLHIRFNDPSVFFRLKRKKDRATRTKSLRLRIDSIEKLDERADCACIKIDSPEELYVTSNYIVTHNTSMMLDCCLKTAYDTGVPVLHFDNGEMSENELIFRIVSSMSGVPQHMLEKGTWRNSSYNGRGPKELIESVRSVWNRLKKTKILYENVAGMTSDEMNALLKRKYYTEVGRGKPMIFSFDYLKTDFTNLGKGSEWAFVGKTLHGFKQIITRDLKFDGEPVVSMITSVQLNRLGITTNRTADNIHETETENAIGLSDNIIQFVSHLFQLRKKTVDERVIYGERFGTHTLKCLAARHLGEEYYAHINPIDTPEGPKDNFINFNFHNFSVEDRGDLRDIVAASNGVTLGSNDLPL